MIVLAMGKMGAIELNYSSDIDLIVFFDADAPALVAGTEPGAVLRAAHARAGEAAAGAHRRRLRVPHRPAAAARSGLDPDRDLDRGGARLLREPRPELGARRDDQGAPLRRRYRGRRGAPRASLSPFIWRKYLDFAAVADIHAMKRQIHAYRGHGEIAVEGHNIKLGRGGIREIEFFVQTQQLIAGGRHPELRGRETLATLDVLADGGWIDAAARDDLDAAYRFLRVVEHRLQMVADEQTHTLPADRDGARALRPLRSASPAATLRRRAARAPAQRAAALCDAVRARAGRRGRTQRRCSSRPTPTTARRSTSSPRWAFATRSKCRRWCAAGSRAAIASLRSEIRARPARRARADRCSHQFARSANPDAAVIAFDRFLGRAARRRPAVFAAAAESRSGRADRARARHRAAARRHPRAVSRR